MHAEVAPAKETHQLRKRAAFQVQRHFELVRCVIGAVQETLRGKASESLGARIGARGLAREIDYYVIRGLRIDAGVRVADVENRFDHTEFEIDPAIDDLDVGDVGVRTGLALGRRRGALKKGLDVPGTGIGLHQVDARLHQLQFRKREVTGEQRRETDPRLDAHDMGERLDARARVVGDEDVFGAETRPAEQVEVNRTHLHIAVQCRFQRLADALPKQVGRRKRRQQSEKDIAQDQR